MSEEPEETVLNVAKVANTLLDLLSIPPTELQPNDEDNTQKVVQQQAETRQAMLDLHDTLVDEGLYKNMTPRQPFLETLYEFCRLEDEWKDTKEWKEKRDTVASTLLGHLHNQEAVKKDREAPWPPLQTQEYLKDFVTEFVGGRIYTDKHVKDLELLTMIFLPLSFGSLAYLSQRECARIGIIWAPLQDAGPRQINGHPIFMTARVMHKDDWKRYITAIKKLKEAQNGIEV